MRVPFEEYANWEDENVAACNRPSQPLILNSSQKINPSANPIMIITPDGIFVNVSNANVPIVKA